MRKTGIISILIVSSLLLTSCSAKSNEVESSVITDDFLESVETEISPTEIVESSSELIRYSDDQLRNIELMYGYANVIAWVGQCYYSESTEFNYVTANNPEAFWEIISNYCCLYNLDNVSEEDWDVDSVFFSNEDLIPIAEALFWDFEEFPSVTEECRTVTQVEGGYRIKFYNYQPFKEVTNYDYYFMDDGSLVITYEVYDFSEPEIRWLIYDSEVIVLPDNSANNSIGLTIEAFRCNNYLFPTPTETPVKESGNWQEAYIGYLETLYTDEISVYASCSLIYLDDDDVPELFLVGDSEASGEEVVSFSNGEIVSQQLSRIGSVYIERSGLILNDCGHMDYYPLTIYLLNDGSFSVVAEGLSGWIDPNVERKVVDGVFNYQYYWQGEQVEDEAAYRACIKEYFDTSLACRPDNLMTMQEMIEYLQGL